ncbi:hypothetical protein [Nevskia ramosa]|uniref:hypothetical protein n=1 Tax=Nevskia ramosa TaxID=64002 RepID=UPI003D128BC1
MSRNARNLRLKKGRRIEGPFSAWLHSCADHPNFKTLTPHAKALLFEFLGQIRTANNGDLSCHWKRMSAAGWRSRTTVEKARAELEARGWIVRTFQGSLGNRCNLYAVTWRGIDECKGKLHVSANSVPLHFWKTGGNPWLERDQHIRPRARRKPLTSGCASNPQLDQPLVKDDTAPPGP